MGYLDCTCNLFFFVHGGKWSNDYKNKTNFPAENICGKEKVRNELTES